MIENLKKKDEPVFIESNRQKSDQVNNLNITIDLVRESALSSEYFETRQPCLEKIF